jgi:hypothetical protein
VGLKLVDLTMSSKQKPQSDIAKQLRFKVYGSFRLIMLEPLVGYLLEWGPVVSTGRNTAVWRLNTAGKDFLAFKLRGYFSVRENSCFWVRHRMPIVCP